MTFGNSTIFLSSNPSDLCDRLKILLQEKQTGNISNKISEKIVAIAGMLLEYKCVRIKHYKFLQPKCLN